MFVGNAPVERTEAAARTMRPSLRSSSRMPFCRGHAHEPSEAPVEAREITKTDIEGDGRDRRFRPSQFNGGVVQTGAQQELMGRHADALTEYPQEMERTDARIARKIVQGDLRRKL